MGELEHVDFFLSREMFINPYPYLEELRGHGPVHVEPDHGVYLVSGFDEVVQVYSTPNTFSSCNAVTGPFPGFPVPLEGDDVSDLIDAHRDELPFTDQLPSFDPPKHTEQRALLMRLITPKRLKENEDFMWVLADRQLDEFGQSGKCEFIGDYAGPYTLLVIADLLGVPEKDHHTFRAKLASTTDLMKKEGLEHKPLEFLYEQFTDYITDLRANPREDVMTGMATATFPDGRVPEVREVALIAANLFVAGQETTVRLLSSMLQYLAEDPDLQQRLRDHRDLIPNFVEEMLRYESPIKGEFRLARRTTEVGGVKIPAGSNVMVLNNAANRDPNHFENPNEFQLERPNARHHVAFGHGIHTCAGAPLARSEARVSLERILDRMGDIRISDAEHGPPGARKWRFVPTYMLRGLTQLHLEFTPLD